MKIAHSKSFGIQLFAVITLTGVLPLLIVGFMARQYELNRLFSVYCLPALALIATVVFAIGILHAIHLTRHINSILTKATAASPKSDEKPVTNELKQLDIAVDKMASNLQKNLKDLELRNTQLEINNQNLQKLDSFKSDFIRFASHEFRTPLTTIRESVSMLAEGLVGPLSEQQSKFVNIAVRNTDRLIEVVQSLILLTKIRTSIKAEEQSVISLKGTLEEALKKAKTHPNAAVLKIADLDAHEFMPVMGERMLLTIAFQNVIDNSLTHAYPNTPVKVGLFSDNGDVKFQVTGQGSRIISGKIGNAFEGLKREVSPQNLPSGHGSILDLTITNEIVKWHRGQMDINTAPNGEIQITLKFPKTAQPVAAPDSGKLPFKIKNQPVMAS